MHVGRYGGAGLGDADEEECSPEGQLQTDLKIQIYLKMTSIPTRSNTPPPSRGASPGDAEMPAASALLLLSFAFYNSVAINPQRDRVTSNKKKNPQTPANYFSSTGWKEAKTPAELSLSIFQPFAPAGEI